VAVKSFRGVLAIILLGTITFYGLTNLVYDPILQTALPPVKEARALGGTPWDYKVEPVIWNIIPVFRKISRDQNASDILSESFNLVPIWLDNGTSDRPSCKNDGHFHRPAFQCTISEINNTVLLPDLFITVNFTTLGEKAHIFDQSTPAITLRLAMAAINPQILVERIEPFVLIPGVNLVAAVAVDIRQVFKRPSLAALGLFQGSESFYTTRLINSYADPNSTIPRGENISTLRVFIQPDNGLEFRIISDYRDNSVVDGFSAVGGLWTTLSGIFAVLFGGSLFHILH